jgi:GNAT superfamily N-acetyltransferase
MAIRTIGPDEVGGFLDFLNAGMRPEPVYTRADEDFPVILAPDNLEGLWGLADESGWAAGLAVLTRSFRTTAGTVRVAGIGSVVTRPDRRGEGLSSRLQTSVLGRLAGQGVPLAVLWSDQPEIYAGRGFQTAGWEYHLDLAGMDLTDLQTGAAEIRPFTAADVTPVSLLYAQHPLRTLRQQGDSARLYTMTGTRGLVLAAGNDVLAYAFCGKGEDFPDYVAEWGGPADLALRVLAKVVRLGLAHRVLVPAGREDLLELAVPRGAGLELWPSGLWAVLRPDLLPGPVTAAAPTGDRDPRRWLGEPGPTGRPVPGRLAIAVWGFDSV